MRLFQPYSSTRHRPDYRTIFEALPAASLVLSRDLEIVAAGDAYLRISGRRRDELVGRRLDRDDERSDRIACVGNDRRLAASVRRVLLTGKPHHCVLRRKHFKLCRDPLDVGRRPVWRVTNTPIHDGRNLAYVVHQVEDVGADGRGSRRIRRWERRLLAMQEDERNRIARELHDQTAQGLAALMLGLEELKGRPDAATGVDRLQELVRQLGHEVHRLTWDLRPAPIEDLGFRSALERLVEELLLRSPCQIHFHSNLDVEDRFDPQVETACYRIVQEGLTNIVRHAQAKVAGVVVSRRDHCLSVIIEDDGTGFDAASVIVDPAACEHLGLRGMRERLALVGGSLDVESTPGRGCSLFIRIPVGEPGATP